MTERCNTCGNQLYRGEVHEWEYFVNAAGLARIGYADPENYARRYWFACEIPEAAAAEICRQHNLQFHDMDPLDEGSPTWSDLGAI